MTKNKSIKSRDLERKITDRSETKNSSGKKMSQFNFPNTMSKFRNSMAVTGLELG